MIPQFFAGKVVGKERIDGYYPRYSRNGSFVPESLSGRVAGLGSSSFVEKKLAWDVESPDYWEPYGDGDDSPEIVNPQLVRSRFPKDIDDFRRRLKDVSPVDRFISFLDLGVDFGRAFSAATDISSRLNSGKFVDREEHLRGRATLIFGQGLGTLYGSKFFRSAAPWTRNMITHGTYAHPIQYLDEMGFSVRVVQAHPILNTGDIEQNVAVMKREVEKAKERSDAPVYCVTHSVDALCAQVYMAENRNEAAELDGFILGAGALPERINPWIGDAFLALGEREDSFPYIEEVLDFYVSGGAKGVNIISMKDSPDRILDGWSGGRVLSVDGGHSAVFHQIENLRTIVHIANETSFPQIRSAA